MNDLPAEIMLHIMQYCPIRDTVKLLSCDRALHDYMSFEPLWHDAYVRDFGMPLSYGRYTDTRLYRYIYRECVEIATAKRFLSWICSDICDADAPVHDVLERARCALAQRPLLYYSTIICGNINALRKHIFKIIRRIRKRRGILVVAKLMVVLDNLCHHIMHTLAEALAQVTYDEGDFGCLLKKYCCIRDVTEFLDIDIDKFVEPRGVVATALRLLHSDAKWRQHARDEITVCEGLDTW